MTNREIYEAALMVLAEQVEDCEDYEARAPYLLGSAIRACAAADAQYRLSHGLDEACAAQGLYVSLDEEFPLCPRFAVAVMYRLAALLVESDDEALAADCHARALTELQSIERSETPGLIRRIGDR